jgi:adenylyltransferase/sulfurtransferase
MTALPDALLRQIAVHARSTYPAECCGIVIADRGGNPRFVPIANIAGTADAQGTSGRTGRDGYVMDPRTLLGELSRAEEEGGFLHVIVHSHPDVGAYFSKEDRDMALGGGTEPLWPGVLYLVVSCRESGVDDAKLYRWDPARSDFEEKQVPITSAFR